jgi:hypothetical protein
VTSTDRQAALHAAVQMHAHLGLALIPGVDRSFTVAQAEIAIRRTADVFAAWLAGTTRLRLIPGPAVDETTGALTGTPIPEGETMTQLNTGQ